jgi:hypothetical protein
VAGDVQPNWAAIVEPQNRNEISHGLVDPVMLR